MTDTETETHNAAAYWEQLWQAGRRYRGFNRPEREALLRQAGHGRGRPALDIGCGTGALTRCLSELAYRPTGIDCAPSAVALARDAYPTLDFQVFDFTQDDPSGLPEPAYSLITCRLVYRWVPDKPAFLSRVRQLLAPGGIFWVATSVHRNRGGTPEPWAITAPAEELLTSGWSRADVTQIDDSFSCFALRP
ncbi:class I SAM-dependent methyltransferase [Streptomyces sp. NPDC006356]